MGNFPREALCPEDATPRITPAHAEEVMRLIEESGVYPTRPAIVIAVWTGGMVKYLVDDGQVEDTIQNFKRPKKKKRGE